MSMEVWLVFVATVSLFFATPGPTNLLVVGQALASGIGPAMWVIWGIIAANVSGLALSFIGLGALLAISTHLFAVLKWLGVAYLVYLGVQQWRHAVAVPGASGDDDALNRRMLFRRGFAVTLLNPKIIIFYAAFLPQFMDREREPVLQMLILGSTYVGLSFAGCVLHAILAGGVRRWLGRSGWVAAVNRGGAVMLIGSGLLTATMTQR